MSLEEILGRFPAKSPLRQIIVGLTNPNLEIREAAADRLDALNVVTDQIDAMTPNWKLSEGEAQATLKAATVLPFPPLKFDWNDSVDKLICLLWRSPYSALTEPAREAYGRMADPGKRAILALLGACGTREAAQAFVNCIRNHGWPESVYARVFMELMRLVDHADVLFPDLLIYSNKFFWDAANTLLGALNGGKLSEITGARFDTVIPLITDRLKQAIIAAQAFQKDTGIAWRFEEDYEEVRREVGLLLDLAGWLNQQAVDDLLEQAMTFRDPRPVAYAAAALIRRGKVVDASVLDRVAASHETRGLLFELLEAMGQETRFPQGWRTWDAFAAADMVEWLCYPAELGREPDRLEKMAVFTADQPDGQLALYVWRFQRDEEECCAGTSGPYKLEGSPRPVSGGSTFSRFDSWDSASAEQHAESVLETLQEWKQAWKKESETKGLGR